MRQRLTLITLGVRDFARALAFYEGLGWKKSAASQEHYALFPLGGIVLGLYPLQALEEVDTVLKEAERLGASIVKPAQKVFWGGYSGYFKDLDGYLFEVAYNPYWQLDSEGKLLL